MNVRKKEWLKGKEQWMNKWINEWRNEWMNGWMNWKKLERKMKKLKDECILQTDFPRLPCSWEDHSRRPSSREPDMPARHVSRSVPDRSLRSSSPPILSLCISSVPISRISDSESHSGCSGWGPWGGRPRVPLRMLCFHPWRARDRVPSFIPCRDAEREGMINSTENETKKKKGERSHRLE